MEDIFHRWKKDLCRFKLYEKYYPIKETPKNVTTKKHIYDISKLNNVNYALHGFAAFALFRKELLKYDDLTFIPNLEIEIAKKKIELDLPILDSMLLLVTNEDINSMDGKHYHPVLGIIPKSVCNDNICIFNVNMLSIVNIGNIKVVTVQYLLMWFLFNYNFNDNINDRSLYGNFYLYTMKMIEISQKVLVNRIKNPFNPSLTFLGDDIPYEPMINQNTNLPVNYTPSRIGTRQIFDYSNFPMSGEEIL